MNLLSTLFSTSLEAIVFLNFVLLYQECLLQSPIVLPPLFSKHLAVVFLRFFQLMPTVAFFIFIQVNTISR